MDKKISIRQFPSPEHPYIAFPQKNLAVLDISRFTTGEIGPQSRLLYISLSLLYSINVVSDDTGVFAFLWAAVFTFNPYLLISINELLISINELLISIIHLLTSINELLISINELLISINELLISINMASSTVFIDIYHSFIDINKKIIDINHSLIDINKYAWRCHIYWYQ